MASRLGDIILRSCARKAGHSEQQRTVSRRDHIDIGFRAAVLEVQLAKHDLKTVRGIADDVRKVRRQIDGRAYRPNSRSAQLYNGNTEHALTPP